MGEIVEIKFETWKPGHRSRVIHADELIEVYENAPVEMSPTLTWNDGGDQVLIVSVGADYSTVTMLDNDTFSDLVVPNGQGFWEVCIAGQDSVVSEATLLPREVGLEVLQHADDFDRLRKAYSWRDQ